MQPRRYTPESPELLNAKNPRIAGVRNERIDAAGLKEEDFYRIASDNRRAMVNLTTDGVPKDLTRSLWICTDAVKDSLSAFYASNAFLEIKKREGDNLGFGNIAIIKEAFFTFLKTETFAQTDEDEINRIKLDISKQIFQFTPEFEALNKDDHVAIKNAAYNFLFALNQTQVPPLSEAEFNETFNQLFSAYNQAVGIEFSKAMSEAIQAHYETLSKAETKIYQFPVIKTDAFSALILRNNTFHVDTTYSNSKFSQSIFSQTKGLVKDDEIPLPGTVEQSFVLVNTTREREKKFRLAYVAPSSEILENLCFNASVDVRKELEIQRKLAALQNITNSTCHDMEIDLLLSIKKALRQKAGAEVASDLTSSHYDTIENQQPDVAADEYNKQSIVFKNGPRTIDLLCMDAPQLVNCTQIERDARTTAEAAIANDSTAKLAFDKYKILRKTREIANNPTVSSSQRLAQAEAHLSNPENKKILDTQRDKHINKFYAVIKFLFSAFSKDKAESLFKPKTSKLADEMLGAIRPPAPGRGR